MFLKFSLGIAFAMSIFSVAPKIMISEQEELVVSEEPLEASEELPGAPERSSEEEASEEASNEDAPVEKASEQEEAAIVVPEGEVVVQEEAEDHTEEAVNKAKVDAEYLASLSPEEREQADAPAEKAPEQEEAEAVLPEEEVVVQGEAEDHAQEAAENDSE